MTNPMYRPMTVKQVYDYLKKKCPNFVVKFGFGSECVSNAGITSVSMVQNVRVDIMAGNLSHIINAGHGNDLLRWPSRYNNDWRIPLYNEPVALDTLLEMGCID